MRFVDANIAIAIQNAADPFHLAALDLIVREPEPLGMLTVTLSEAIVRPSMAGRGDEAAADLGRLFDIQPVDTDTAVLAARFRSEVVASGLSGNRLPMLDALVLAAGRLGTGVVTADAGWPLDVIQMADLVEVLGA